MMVMEKNLYDAIYEKNIKFPNKTILYYFSNRIKTKTFFQHLNIWSYIFSKKYNISKGDVVSINLPNIPNCIICFYALNKIGAIVNLIHPLKPIGFVRDYVEYTKSKLLITSNIFQNENCSSFKNIKIPYIVCNINDYCESEKGNINKQSDYFSIFNRYKRVKTKIPSTYFDEAVYMHSGGTLDEPKTVVLQNNAINAVADCMKNCYRDIDSREKCVLALPLFHGFGLASCMHNMLTRGTALILIPKFETKKMLDLIYESKAGVFMGVPKMYSLIFDSEINNLFKIKSIKYFFVGGDKFDNNLRDFLIKKARKIGCKGIFREGYGLTETGAICCLQRKNDKKYSLGNALKGIDVCIIDDDGNDCKINQYGEICVSGRTLMKEYYSSSCENVFFLKNGKKYLRTGDIGYFDSNNSLHFLERKKRVFKINGINVFPSEIEERLKKTFLLNECVLQIEKSNPYFFVVSDKNEKNFKSKIINFIKNNYMKCIVPLEKNIILCKKIPVTGINKINFGELALKIKNV